MGLSAWISICNTTSPRSTLRAIELSSAAALMVALVIGYRACLMTQICIVALLLGALLQFHLL